MDKGAGDIRVVKTLLALKRRQPSQAPQSFGEARRSSAPRSTSSWATGTSAGCSDL